MTIAEKITRAKADYDEVYEAGKAAGSDSQYDTFWDAFQQNGTRTNYARAFYENVGWNATTFRPKYDIVPKYGGEILQAFYKTGDIGDLNAILEDCGVVLDLSKCEELNGVFYGAGITTLPVIDCSSCLSFISTFGSNNMVSITEVRNVQETATFNTASFSALLLEEVRFTGTIGTSISFQEAPRLSVDSIKNIISHLKNYAGTDDESTYKITIRSERWDALEASGSAPNGGTWKDYVMSLGWIV